MKVYIAIYDHKHGRDVRAFANDALAEAWRQEIAAAWWDQEMDSAPRPDDPHDMANEYFDTMADRFGGEEFFDIEETELVTESN